MICVLDCETTGLVPGKYDLIQLAIVPLDDQLDLADIPPFKIYMYPIHYRDDPLYLAEISPAMVVNKINLNYLLSTGLKPNVALELFDNYFKRRLDTRIEPLCQNYPFDSGFVKAWLGPELYDTYFARQYRDTYSLSNAIKDRAKLLGLPNPFPKGARLSTLAESLGVPVTNAHDAFADCITTAAVYKKMLLSLG